MEREILVVDDSSDIRNLLRLHLSGAGYRVKLAEDAVEAGRMLLARAPDLMIVDVGMPYLDGFDFVASIVADSTVPVFPILFLTSREDAEDRAHVLGARCVKKPITADRLLSAVAEALENRPLSPSPHAASPRRPGS